MNYRVFNIEFQCDFPLPELPAGSDGNPVFSVTLGEWPVGGQEAFDKRFEFTDRHGIPAFWCGRRGDDYLFVFPGFARYWVNAGSQIHCLAENDCPMEMLRHLLINQVIPRLLGTRGHLVVHASAVRPASSGAAVAFLGNSGYGKSTLASSFHRHGAAFISDDGVLVSLDGQEPVVSGGLPGIRLLSDSVDAIFSDADGFEPVTPFSAKKQLSLKDRITERVPLAALFVLNDPVEDPVPDHVRIAPMSGAEAMMAITLCLFSLDPTERLAASRGFRNVGDLVAGTTPVYSLGFPRDLGRLGEVRQAVEDCVAAGK